jgi:hypothetical protein
MDDAQKILCPIEIAKLLGTEFELNNEQMKGDWPQQAITARVARRHTFPQLMLGTSCQIYQNWIMGIL